MRSRLRERRRTEERSKAALQEEREKAGEGRLERNKRWRQRKETHHSSSSSSSSTISTSSSLKELVDNQEEEEKQSRRREPSERRQDEQSQKNPISASAMLTGRFLQIRKVFATSSLLVEEFPDTLQYKISR